jgi:hypothetical protein
MFMCLNISFKFILKGLLMKKFLFLFVFSFMCASGFAQVPNGPTTPVPPIPVFEPVITEPVIPVPMPPEVITPPTIDLPLLPPINLPVFPTINWPTFPNVVPPFLEPPLTPMPDPIGNNEPPLLTQSWCQDLRNQIYEIQSELWPLYGQFNAKRTTILASQKEIEELDALINKLTAEVIELSLEGKDVPADLRNQISNRTNWRVWVMQRINRLKAEIIPIERDIEFWESFLPELEEAMRKAGC